MTRQVHEISATESGVLGHITSLRPIRAENAPDPWETKALQAFENGSDEFSSLELIANTEYLRFMKPLKTESPCLKCHASQGYMTGDIRGGISVSVPMKGFRAAEQLILRNKLSGFGLIWVIGLLAIGTGSRQLYKKTEQLRKEESRYRTIFENIQDVFYQTDVNGNFTEISPSIFNYSGYRREELIGKAAANFYANPEDWANLLGTLQKTGKVIDYELLLTAIDNRQVHVSLNAH